MNTKNLPYMDFLPLNKYTHNKLVNKHK